MDNQQLVSLNPATGDMIWQATIASGDVVTAAVQAARSAFADWSSDAERRLLVVQAYGDRLQAETETVAETIAIETGKPLWEARQEVGSMIGKIAISIAAQKERAGEREQQMPFGRAVLRHRAHGVMAVLGPYNFPGHLPNGHIVPALLAGDTIVFKPSEETPMTGEVMARLWHEAGLPDGVLTVVQGGRATGAALLAADIDGVLFTGSAATGAVLRRQFIDRPEVILALELGGNNPLIAWDGTPDAVASIIVASAFATSGQRCSCARRLIVPDGADGIAIVDAVVTLARRLRIGQWDETPEPAMGPLISARAAAVAMRAQTDLIALGAQDIDRMKPVVGRSAAFLTPGILDVTGITVPDEEIFAPLLQVIRVHSFDEAVQVANATRFGLAGGLISADRARWEQYAGSARAGVVNWNRPTTGASGAMPFGGLGSSGNHRPSGYYAADYCAYPAASFEAASVADLSGEIRGLLG